MPNGKPGDHPYTDMVSHRMDLGEPEIADRLREVDAIAGLDVKHVISDLVEYLFPGARGMPADYQRKRLLDHLDTIEKLCTAERARKSK